MKHIQTVFVSQGRATHIVYDCLVHGIGCQFVHDAGWAWRVQTSKSFCADMVRAHVVTCLRSHKNARMTLPVLNRLSGRCVKFRLQLPYVKAALINQRFHNDSLNTWATNILKNNQRGHRVLARLFIIVVEANSIRPVTALPSSEFLAMESAASIIMKHGSSK